MAPGQALPQLFPDATLTLSHTLVTVLQRSETDREGLGTGQSPYQGLVCDITIDVSVTNSITVVSLLVQTWSKGSDCHFPQRELKSPPSTIGVLESALCALRKPSICTGRHSLIWLPGMHWVTEASLRARRGYLRGSRAVEIEWQKVRIVSKVLVFGCAVWCTSERDDAPTDTGALLEPL